MSPYPGSFDESVRMGAAIESNHVHECVEIARIRIANDELRQLIRETDRLIAATALAKNETANPLVIDRITHCQSLAEAIRAHMDRLATYLGGTP